MQVTKIDDYIYFITRILNIVTLMIKILKNSKMLKIKDLIISSIVNCFW